MVRGLPKEAAEGLALVRQGDVLRSERHVPLRTGSESRSRQASFPQYLGTDQKAVETLLDALTPR